MFVPSVAKAIPCSDALAIPIDPFRPVCTPLHWKSWLDALLAANLLEEFNDVPHGLRFGFRLGPTCPISHSFIPCNHNSATSNPSAIQDHISTELRLQRYTGPFHPDRLEQLIGPFQCSPLGVVPKANGLFRIIQDMSYPRDSSPVSSINSQISSADFPSEWSTFALCYWLVARAPPGSQAAVFDVDSAYRNIPVFPADQNFCCVQFLGSIYIDHCLDFGCTSSCGIFGRPADALVALFKHMSVPDILKWVDDFVFFRYPVSLHDVIPSYSYDESLIWSVAKTLGWPWSTSKHQPFAQSFTYLGFQWDLQLRTVQIPEPKKVKYLSRLRPWLTLDKAILRDAQKLLGTLNHCTLVIPDGPSHLPSLFKFVAGFKNTLSPFVSHTISASLRADIVWWQSQLSNAFCGSLVHTPPPLLPHVIYVDASTSWGIGVLINGHWEAFHYVTGARTTDHNIGWAEMVAVEVAVGILVSILPRDSHVHIRSDNQGVLAAIRNKRSRGSAANESLQRQCQVMLAHNFWTTASYVSSAQNLADPISRGSLPPLSLRLSHLFVLPDVLRPLLRAV